MAEPLIRAGLTKIALKGIYRELEASQARVLRDVPEDEVETVEQGFGTAWLPARVHVHICDAILAHCGEQGYVKFWRDVTDVIMEAPMFRKVAESATRLYRGPVGLFRATPHAWPTMAKHLGGFEMSEHGRGVARMTYQGFTPELAATGSYALAFQGAFLGYIKQTGAEGSVELIDRDFSSGNATYELRWAV